MVHGKCESVGHDADYRVDRAPQPEGAPDDIGSRREA